MVNRLYRQYVSGVLILYYACLFLALEVSSLRCRRCCVNSGGRLYDTGTDLWRVLSHGPRWWRTHRVHASNLLIIEKNIQDTDVKDFTVQCNLEMITILDQKIPTGGMGPMGGPTGAIGG